MRSVLLGLVLLCQSTEFLKVNLPTLEWICPWSVAGRHYLAFSRLTMVKNGIEVTQYCSYLLTPTGAKARFTIGGVGHALPSPDGQRVIFNQAYNSAVYQLGLDKPLATPMGAAWINDKLVTIESARNGSFTELRINGRKVNIPNKHEPYLLSSCAPFVLTAKPVWQSRMDLEKAAFRTKHRVKIWHLTEAGIGKLHRDVGHYYWDGGSTGDPSIFEVNAEGAVLSDQPLAANVLFRPYIVAPGKPARWVLGDQWDDGCAMEMVLAVGRHFVATLRAFRAGQRESVGAGAYYDIPLYVAWTDGRTMAVRPYPKGLVGLWGEGESTLCIATKAPGGVSIERVQLPPTKWEQHFLGDSVDQSPD